MRHLGFTSCPADPDVWMRSAIQSDGSKHYEYILLYIDDALAIGNIQRSCFAKELLSNSS
eukprot:3875560-Ditylum_brightwellii.AAC.1